MTNLIIIGFQLFFIPHCDEKKITAFFAKGTTVRQYHGTKVP